MAVSGGKGLIGHDIGVGIAKPPRRFSTDQIVQRLIGKAGNTDVKQAHINMLAGACPLGMHDSRQNGRGCIGAGQHIDQRHTDLHGHAIWLSGHAHQPAHALDHEVIAGAICVGSIHAETGDRAIDKRRIDRTKRFIIQAISGKPANLEILDKNIRTCRQIAQNGGAVFRRDIDGKRPLVSVYRTEIGRPRGGICCVIASDIIGIGRTPAAGIITAAGAFDLDDVGTKVSQHLRGPGASKNA